MIYFTADLHFGHANVIEYEKRPFQTAEEMDEALIRNWNAKVGPEDDIYILGDFTLKGSSFANAVLERLQGRKYLIRGNHDGFADRETFRQEAFAWVGDYLELEWRDLRLVLCHYPLLTWNRMRRGTFQLHGHMHNTRAYNEANRLGGLRRLDVGVDAQNMAPVSAEELWAFWEEEHHPDSWYGSIKPKDIRLECICKMCPEEYYAYDKDGKEIACLRVKSGEFTIETPHRDPIQEDFIYEAWTAGWFCFDDDERGPQLEKAKRAIAEYYRSMEYGV